VSGEYGWAELAKHGWMNYDAYKVDKQPFSPSHRRSRTFAMNPITLAKMPVIATLILSMFADGLLQKLLRKAVRAFDSVAEKIARLSHYVQTRKKHAPVHLLKYSSHVT
jgi:hypothetical protein